MTDNVSYMYGKDVAEGWGGTRIDEVPEPHSTVTIPRSQFEELQESYAWLIALEHAGVDNWNGIDFAREIYDTFNAHS